MGFFTMGLVDSALIVGAGIFLIYVSFGIMKKLAYGGAIMLACWIMYTAWMNQAEPAAQQGLGSWLSGLGGWILSIWHGIVGKG